MPGLSGWVCRVLVAGAAVGLGLCGTAAPGWGQSSRQQKPYTIPITVRRVVLDVVVRDKNHHVVHGLKRDDFRVFEDEVPQKIRDLEEERFDRTAPFRPPRLPPLPPDTYTNVPTEPDRGPLYAIVYDMPDISGDGVDGPAQQAWARQELQKFLESAPPGARFSLWVVAEDVYMVQGFTADRAKLLAAFDVGRKEGHLPWVFLYGANYPPEPWEVLAFLGRYLEGLPGRKNLIWMASHFPIDIPQWELPEMQGGTKNMGGGYKPAPGTMGESFDEKVMREAIDAIDNAQVSIYPVDTGGVGFLDEAGADAAMVTGGHAYQSNDVAADLRDAVEDGESYYEISYAPTAPDYDGKMRKIRVEVNRRGDTLEYRQYYFADAPNAPLTNEEKKMAAAAANQIAAHKPGDRMHAYMERGAPEAHQILFRAQVHAGPTRMATPEETTALRQQPAYFAVNRKGQALETMKPIALRPVTIDYVVLDRDARREKRGRVFEFAACAYNTRGKIVNGISQDAEPAGEQKGTKQPFFVAQQTLEVPMTAAWLRVGVRDLQTDQIGTIEVPLPLADEGVAKGAATGSGSRR